MYLKGIPGFAWLFNACCYMFMISGFGNVFHQQWEFHSIGSCIGVISAFGYSAVMGLNKITDIIGKVGPLLYFHAVYRYCSCL